MLNLNYSIVLNSMQTSSNLLQLCNEFYYYINYNHIIKRCKYFSTYFSNSPKSFIEIAKGVQCIFSTFITKYNWKKLIHFKAFDSRRFVLRPHVFNRLNCNRCGYSIPNSILCEFFECTRFNWVCCVLARIMTRLLPMQ